MSPFTLLLPSQLAYSRYFSPLSLSFSLSPSPPLSSFFFGLYAFFTHYHIGSFSILTPLLHSLLPDTLVTSFQLLTSPPFLTRPWIVVSFIYHIYISYISPIYTHIYIYIYLISVPHSAWYSPGPFIYKQIPLVHFFLTAMCILLCKCSIVCLVSLLFLGTQFASRFWIS